VFNLNVLFKSVMAFAVAFFILLVSFTPALAEELDINENLQINMSWGGGDILSLDILDTDTGEHQQVAIRLSDFISEGENFPYILLQTMDFMGDRLSGIIQIENPLFEPRHTAQTVGNSGSAVPVNELPNNIQSVVANANEPSAPTLTPDGTGTVVDNIMTVNEIEFFTVTTGNGSDFFLVIDRQRTSNNVYLLNAVTEADLMALAEVRGETLQPVAVNEVIQAEQPDPPPTLEEILLAIQESAEPIVYTNAPAPQTGGRGGLALIILIAIIGGIGFLVWKVLLPKLMGMGKEEEIEEEEDDFDNSDMDFSAVEVDGDDFPAVEFDESMESEGETDDEEYY